MHIDEFLAKTVILLGSSVAVLLLSCRLRVPPVIGLLLTGVMVGPSGLGGRSVCSLRTGSRRPRRSSRPCGGKRYPSLRGGPAYYLGRIAARQGRRPKTFELMREALERPPGHTAYFAQLAVLTDEQVHAVRLQRYLDRADARYFLGEALLESGRLEEAAGVLEHLVAEVPEHEPGRALLQRALTARGAARAAPGPSRGAAP